MTAETPVADTSSALRRLSLICSVAGSRVAFSANDVFEVVPQTEFSPVPGAAASIAGVMELRGAVLVVVDLARSLWPERSRQSGQQVVVLEWDGAQVGLWVERVIAIRELEVRFSEAAAAEGNQTAVYTRYEEEMIPYLALETYLQGLPVTASAAHDDAEAATSSDCRFLTVGIGQSQLGLRIEQVREVLDEVTATRVPGMKPVVMGVFNLRGEIVPIIDLGRRLSLDSASEQGKIVVVEQSDHTYGLWVDDIWSVQVVDEDRLEPPPMLGLQIHPRFASSIALLQGQRTSLLNLATILDLEQLQ